MVWNKNNNAPFVETELGRVVLTMFDVRESTTGPSCIGRLTEHFVIWAGVTLSWCAPFGVLFGQVAKVCAGRNPQDMEDVVHKKLPNLPT